MIIITVAKWYLESRRDWIAYFHTETNIEEDADGDDEKCDPSSLLALEELLVFFTFPQSKHVTVPQKIGNY